MLKGLPCLKKEQECKVNLVQGGEGWRTPEDSWMDLEDVGDKVYFVNVLLRGEEDEVDQEAVADLAKTDSDKEMERELAVTEMAIDSNTRRRAKRAGVEVSRRRA
jgi:hypothetical protein